MSKAKKGENHLIYKQIRPFIAGSPAQRIEVKDLGLRPWSALRADLLTNKSTIYDYSISATAATLDIKQSTISSYFSRN